MNLDAMKGAARSITIWAGGVLLALGQVAPYVDQDMLESIGLHGKSMRLTLTVSGLIMWVCRTITTKSLSEKGGAPPAPTVASIPSGSTITGDKIVVKPPGEQG